MAIGIQPMYDGVTIQDGTTRHRIIYTIDGWYSSTKNKSEEAVLYKIDITEFFKYLDSITDETEYNTISNILTEVVDRKNSNWDELRSKGWL